MPRGTVSARAAMIYAYLRAMQDRPVSIAELTRRFRIVNGDTTRRALREVAALARADDLCLRIPCPANDYTLALTDRPDEIVDALAFLGRTAGGIIRRGEKHAAIIRQRIDAMPPGPERDRVEQYVRLHGLVEAAAAAADVEASRLVAERRDARKAAAAI